MGVAAGAGGGGIEGIKVMSEQRLELTLYTIVILGALILAVLLNCWG